MKRIYIGIAGVASLLTTSALAADLAPHMYTKAPAPIVAVYDWTGFYIGGNVGYSWGRSSTTGAFSDALTDTVLAAAATKFDLNGVIGGGQIGYNWQRSNWVFGLEADIQGSGEKGSTTSVCAGAAPSLLTTAAAVNSACALGHFGDTAPFNVAALPVTNSLSENIDWFGTVRGRIGPTITPTILAYVTGGLAYGEVKSTDTVSGTIITGAPNGTNGPTTLVPVSATFGNSSTRVGWTLGAGIEGVISGNWTAKLEYLYIDLGNVSGSIVTPVVAPSGNFVTASYNSHVTDNILRVGLNYRWGGPVVAKY
jgi:outer membrane immunogenic protein